MENLDTAIKSMKTWKENTINYYAVNYDGGTRIELGINHRGFWVVTFGGNLLCTTTSPKIALETFNKYSPEKQRIK